MTTGEHCPRLSMRLGNARPIWKRRWYDSPLKIRLKLPPFRFQSRLLEPRASQGQSLELSAPHRDLVWSTTLNSLTHFRVFYGLGFRALGLRVQGSGLWSKRKTQTAPKHTSGQRKERLSAAPAASASARAPRFQTAPAAFLGVYGLGFRV